MSCVVSSSMSVHAASWLRVSACDATPLVACAMSCAQTSKGFNPAGVLAFEPAPVQVNFKGFPWSTGARFPFAACLLAFPLPWFPPFSLSGIHAPPPGRSGHPWFPPFPDPRLHSICRRLLSDPSRWGLADSPCPAHAHVTNSKRTPASPRSLLATVSPRRLRTRSTTPNACCCCRPSTTSTAIGTASSPRHRRVRPGRLCSRRAAKSCAFPTSIL